MTDVRHALIAVDDRFEEGPDVASPASKARKVNANLAHDVGHRPLALHCDTCLDAPMDDVLLVAAARAAGTRIALSND